MSQQPNSPKKNLSLKPPPPPCAALLVLLSSNGRRREPLLELIKGARRFHRKTRCPRQEVHDRGFRKEETSSETIIQIYGKYNGLKALGTTPFTGCGTTPNLGRIHESCMRFVMTWSRCCGSNSVQNGGNACNCVWHFPWTKLIQNFQWKFLTIPMFSTSWAWHHNSGLLPDQFSAKLSMLGNVCQESKVPSQGQRIAQLDQYAEKALQALRSNSD